MVEGAYVNSEGSLLVSIKIMTFADASTATSVEGQLHASAHTGDIGWVCPQSGAGANVCNGNIPSSAMVDGWTNHYHRYLDVSGPDNYWNGP